MKMLVLVLNDEQKVDDVLLSLSKIGINGATVIDSVGMGGILGVKIPFFSLFESHVRVHKPSNKTIFTIIDNDSTLRHAVDMLRVSLKLEKPGTGFLFVVPVLEAYGTTEIAKKENL